MDWNHMRSPDHIIHTTSIFTYDVTHMLNTVHQVLLVVSYI